ncbi:MAG: hypothetical protein AAFY48_09720 [Bacteroidota bacterium]
MASFQFYDDKGVAQNEMVLPVQQIFKVTSATVAMVADNAGGPATGFNHTMTDITINVDHQAATPKSLFVEFNWTAENVDDVAFDCQVNLDDAAGGQDIIVSSQTPIDLSQTQQPAPYTRTIEIPVGNGGNQLREGSCYNVTALFFLVDQRGTTDRRVLAGTIDLGAANIF